MKKLLTLILVLCSIVGFAQMRGGAQYDPGAARSNLSNVDATATPSMTSITLSDKIRAVWADILGDIYASGTVKVSTGTAAAPAYSFSSDPDTGIYSPGAGSLDFTTNGDIYWRMTSTGQLLVATLSPDLSLGARIETFGGIGVFGAVVSAPLLSCGVVDYLDSANTMRIMAGSGVVFNKNISIAPYGGNVLIATTTDDGSNKLQVNGFTKLGDAATGIKMKVLTGTTAAAEGGAANLAHGITDANKIIGFNVSVFYAEASAVTWEHQAAAGYQFHISHNETNFSVNNHATNSENILSKPITILVWYRE